MPDSQAPSGRSTGWVILAVLVFVAVAAIVIALQPGRRDEANRRAPEPSPTASSGLDLPPPDRAGLERWADGWIAKAGESRALAEPGYDRDAFLRELTTLVKSRDASPTFRDQGKYGLLAAGSSFDEVARTPAIKAALVVGERAGAGFEADVLNPTVFLADLDPDGGFAAAKSTNWPESLRKLAAEQRTARPLDVVLMRRRLRDRLSDILAIARAADRMVPPPGFPNRYPLLAWAKSLDADRLEEANGQPPPGSLPFFAITDLAAAELVAASWPIEAALRAVNPTLVNPATVSTLDPFVPSSADMMAGLGTLKARSTEEIPRIAAVPGEDRGKLDAFAKAIEEISLHEDDRELRVFRAGWRPTEID